MSDENSPSAGAGGQDSTAKAASFSAGGAIIGALFGWLLFDELIFILFGALIGGLVVAGGSRLGTGQKANDDNET
ncbi:MAG: hypothetical protein ACQRW7_03095 [Caulobacterales bacterium]|uniref:hypothetical protein n=1 Tax=Glycocaulis sp. TaxID=1969725 RepID=UPI003FA14CE4